MGVTLVVAAGQRSSGDIDDPNMEEGARKEGEQDIVVCILWHSPIIPLT
jgi:hypothetical protein